MRLNRTVAAVASAAMIGLVPVTLASSPAQAATPVEVQIAPEYSTLIYGTLSDFEATVRTTGGSSVSAGTVKLQAQTLGSSWKTVREVPASGYVSIENIKPQEGTNYRIAYSGGSDSSGTYDAAMSRTVRINVARKITHPQRGLVLKGKVTPSYKKKKIVITTSKRSNGGFKKFRTIRTNAAGKYRIKLPVRRGMWHYKVTVPGDKRFVNNWYKWWVRG